MSAKYAANSLRAAIDAGQQLLLSSVCEMESNMVSPSGKIGSKQSSHVEQNCVNAEKKLLQVTKNEEGVTQISMAHRPVNALNYQLLTALREALEEAKSNGSTGVILTSAFPTVFSAGLDLTEMIVPDEKHLVRFWNTLLDTWLALSTLDIPIAVAINGACAAGACGLALVCEYRVMVDGKGTIGLNETRLGTWPPEWLITSMVDVIGQRQTELAVLKGTMFTAPEAFKIGLVDELAADKEQAIAKCHEYIASYASIPVSARHTAKLILREKRLNWMKNNRKADLEIFLARMKNPETQNRLELYLAYLQNRSKL